MSSSDELQVTEPDHRQTPRAPTSPGRMGVLDGLRFLAALSVMMYHFTARTHTSWGDEPLAVFPGLSDLTVWGAYGVDLFFIISGFVILMTAWGRYVRSFATSRITRLFPAYWAGVLLTGVLLIVLWPGHKDIDATDVGVNLTMLQTAFGYPHVDGVYWTLWAELRFYVLVGILLVVGLTGARVLAFAALWPALGAMAHSADVDLLAELLVWNYAPLFAGGMAMFVLTRDPRSVLAWLVLLQNVVLGAAWSGLHSRGIIGRGSGMELPELWCALIIVACFTVVGLATLTPLRRVAAGWLTTAGLLTYPLYLLHEYWGWWFIDVLNDALPRYVVLAIAMAAVIVMAWLVHRFVERPLAPRLKRGLNQAFTALSAMDAATGRRSPDAAEPRREPEPVGR
jgi:peptidoglycan/LPS O-acetylase OafA/YrhL